MCVDVDGVLVTSRSVLSGLCSQPVSLESFSHSEKWVLFLSVEVERLQEKQKHFIESGSAVKESDQISHVALVLEKNMSSSMV